MRAWMVMGAAMLVGVGVPGTDRVVPLPVYAAEQAADQAAEVLADMRAALGGARLEQVKAVSLEGPFRREMGQRQAEGTVVLVLQGPDKMHRSEDTEFPGGTSIERITAVSGATSWEDTQNRGGDGRRDADDDARPRRRRDRRSDPREDAHRAADRRNAALAVRAARRPVRRGHVCRRRRVARRQGRHARDEGRARPGRFACSSISRPTCR